MHQNPLMTAALAAEAEHEALGPVGYALFYGNPNMGKSSSLIVAKLMRKAATQFQEYDLSDIEPGTSDAPTKRTLAAQAAESKAAAAAGLNDVPRDATQALMEHMTATRIRGSALNMIQEHAERWALDPVAAAMTARGATRLDAIRNELRYSTAITMVSLTLH